MEIPSNVNINDSRESHVIQTNVILKHYTEECLILTQCITQLISDKKRAVNEYSSPLKKAGLRYVIRELTKANEECQQLNRTLSKIIKHLQTPGPRAEITATQVELHVINELYVTMLSLNYQYEKAYQTSAVNEHLIHIMHNDMKMLNRLL